MKPYIRWVPASAVTLCLLFGAGCGHHSESVVPPSRIVAYAQPAVFLVEDFGDIDVTAPSGATTKKQFDSQATPAALPGRDRKSVV